MAYSAAEIQLLFEPDPVLSIPVPRKAIVLPAAEIPGREELETLGRMLKAMNWKPGSYRYIYSKGSTTEALTIPGLEVVLEFCPSGLGVFAPDESKREVAEWIRLPSLALIQSSTDLKRAVWNSVRRFSEL